MSEFRGVAQFYALTVTAKGKPLVFKERDLAKFFEGDDLDAATVFLEKLKFIIDPTLPAAPDNASLHAAIAARETNGTTWKRLGAIPQGEALPEPKPLPLDGRYSIPEMVAHDRQTGILARAMLARMNGQD